MDDEEDFGPDLVIKQGDCEFVAVCGGCQKWLGTIQPNQSLDIFMVAWDRHVNRERCRG